MGIIKILDFYFSCGINSFVGNVAELVDAADSKSAGATLESSILSIPTKIKLKAIANRGYKLTILKLLINIIRR